MTNMIWSQTTEIPKDTPDAEYEISTGLKVGPGRPGRSPGTL